MKHLLKVCMVLACVGVLAGLAGLTPARADFGENFTVDETCGGSGLCSEAGGTLTDVDAINFTYRAVLDQNIDGGILDGSAGDTFIEVGFIDYTGYIDDSGSAIAGQALNFDYKLYATFTATGTAAFVNGEIVVTFDTFVINIYTDDDSNTVITLPDDPEGGEVTTLTSNADDRLVATATLLGESGAFIRGTNLANGDFAVELTDFGLAAFGANFFSDPTPFYQIMELDGNTSQVGVSNACPASVADGGTGTRLIESTTGFEETPSVTADFETCLGGSGQMFFRVPEPGTMGMLGLGLIALGFVSRRRRAQA